MHPIHTNVHSDAVENKIVDDREGFEKRNTSTVKKVL